MQYLGRQPLHAWQLTDRFAIILCLEAMWSGLCITFETVSFRSLVALVLQELLSVLRRSAVDGNAAAAFIQIN